jgi:hypothetical protein
MRSRKPNHRIASKVLPHDEPRPIKLHLSNKPVVSRFGYSFHVQYRKDYSSNIKHRMLKLRQLFSGCLLAVFMASSTTSSSAQTSGNNTASLGQMPCQNVEDVRYETTNEDVSIGYEVFRSIGTLYTTTYGSHTIFPSDTGAFVCRLAGAGQRPVYRTLNLAFGLSDDNNRVRESTVRLSVYLDGDFYQYQDVTRGQKYIWPIDVTDTRSVALEIECVRVSRYRGTDACASLVFLEDSLE